MEKDQLSNRIKLQLDGNKLLSHLDTVEDWMKDPMEVNPFYIAFSPSSMCNHKCTFCVYHYKEFKPIYFPKDQYFSLVDEWKNMGVKSVFFAGDGDPLMNKSCVEMIEYTKKSGIDIALNTNGRLLNKNKIPTLVENLSWIRVSLNAGSPESYGKIHGTSSKDFNTVIENLKMMVDYSKKVDNPEFVIGVQCLLLEENFSEIRDLAKLLKGIGVHYLAIKPFLQHPLITYHSDLTHKDEKLKELKKAKSLNDDNFKFVLRENNFKPATDRPYKKCLSGPLMIEVDANGDVYSCGPHIGNKDHLYGNVLNKSFKEMWNSEKRKSVMKSIQENVDVSKCMPFCRPDSVNRFLWEIKNPPLHVNYI